jgi:hypothetical protein
VKGRLVVVSICAALVAVGILIPSALNAVFDALDLAFGWMGAFWTVTLVSAGVGVLFILAFPHVSWQRGIVLVKDRIKWNLLSIRLFQDDLLIVLKSTAGTLLWNFAYIGLNLLPMAVLAAPFMIVWFQLNALYAFDPLPPGAKRLVEVELAAGVDPAMIQVTAPEGVEVLRTVRVADPKEPRLLLDLRADAPGRHELTLTSGGDTVAKSFEVGERGRRLARLRTSEPFSRFAAAQDPIMFFGESVLPADSFVRAISVAYPAKPLGFLAGGEISIMIWFVVVSLVVGFGLKGVFGVEI